MSAVLSLGLVQDNTHSAILPPHSMEAEQSVLGGLLLDNSSWDRMGDLIIEDDFYHRHHRIIYQHIAKLLMTAQAADVVTVHESLKSEGEEKNIDAGYLNDLARGTPSAANIRYYAEIVRDRAIKRKLIQVGTLIIESTQYHKGQTAQQLLDEAQSNVLAIAEANSRKQQGFISIRTLAEQLTHRIDELYHRNDPSDIIGLSTGFVELDKMTAGLQAGDLIIVAGRPSMGKTAFSMNIAEHIGIQQKLPVGIFSMEMSGAQLTLRLTSSMSKLPHHKLRTGQIQEEDFAQLSRCLRAFSESPIYIDETPALNTMELRTRARRLYRQYGGLSLIVVDYLQLMSSYRQGDNRTNEISEISRSLKALARELNVPIIALSQLNRSLEQRVNKRPIMSDLRESGAIEQDADVILFIYREEVYDANTPDKGSAEIIIGKQRNGPIGTVRLTFLSEYTRFENYIPSQTYTQWQPN